MLPQGDSWELEVELAFAQLANDEQAFRERMAELGFTDDEIERHLTLERAMGELS